MKCIAAVPMTYYRPVCGARDWDEGGYGETKANCRHATSTVQDPIAKRENKSAAAK
jgi:hypothetical protein